MGVLGRHLPADLQLAFDNRRCPFPSSLHSPGESLSLPSHFASSLGSCVLALRGRSLIRVSVLRFCDSPSALSSHRVPLLPHAHLLRVQDPAPVHRFVPSLFQLSICSGDSCADRIQLYTLSISSATAALSFHRVAFKDRLSEIEFNVAVLDRLNLYRPKIKKTYAQGGGTSGYTSSGAATPLKSLFTGAGRKVSPDQTKSAGKTTSRKGSWSEKSAFEKRFDEDGIERDGGHSYPPRQDVAEEEKKHGFEKFVGNVGKNVKRVALHDARNVKGKAGRAAEDELTSNLNSSKVAKVRLTSQSPTHPLLGIYVCSAKLTLATSTFPLRLEPRPEHLQVVQEP